MKPLMCYSLVYKGQDVSGFSNDDLAPCHPQKMPGAGVVGSFFFFFFCNFWDIIHPFKICTSVGFNTSQSYVDITTNSKECSSPERSSILCASILLLLPAALKPHFHAVSTDLPFCTLHKHGSDRWLLHEVSVMEPCFKTPQYHSLTQASLLFMVE